MAVNLERIKPSAKLLLSLDEYIVLDIETSGLSPAKGGRIIEIGGIRVKNGKIIDIFSQLINPGCKIYTTTIELTGITNEMLVGKPSFQEVMPKFHDFIRNTPVVGHNIAFDWRFLTYFFESCCIQVSNKTIDTIAFSKYVFPDEKSHKLELVCERLNIVNENAHRALDDVIATNKALDYFKLELQKEPAFKEDEQLTLFSVSTTEVSKDDYKLEYSNFIIKSVKFNEKKNSKRVLSRTLLVILNIGTIYFDFFTKQWSNTSKESRVTVNIDFKDVERRLISSPAKMKMIKTQTAGRLTNKTLMEYFHMHEMPEVQSRIVYDIKSIRYWSKHNMRRIYISLSLGTVFYDVVKNGWANKDVSVPVNYRSLENQVLKLLGYTNPNGLSGFTGEKKIS